MHTSQSQRSKRPNAPTHQRSHASNRDAATELPALTVWRNAAFDLRREITATAEAIADARTIHGEHIIRTDAPWRVVEAVAHSHYCLAIADVARVLGVARQTAHPFVHAAARQGFLELMPNPHDRRILQLLAHAAR